MCHAHNRLATAVADYYRLWIVSLARPLKPIKPYSALLVISHCALRRKDSLCALARWFCQQKGRTDEKAMVGTRRVTPHSDSMDRLRKHYSYLAEDWFLARMAAWSHERVYGKRQC